MVDKETVRKGLESGNCIEWDCPDCPVYSIKLKRCCEKNDTGRCSPNIENSLKFRPKVQRMLEKWLEE